MVLGWVLVLVLAVSVFRLAGYAERKLRARALRVRRRQDQGDLKKLPPLRFFGSRSFIGAEVKQFPNTFLPT